MLEILRPYQADVYRLEVLAVLLISCLIESMTGGWEIWQKYDRALCEAGPSAFSTF